MCVQKQGTKKGRDIYLKDIIILLLCTSIDSNTNLENKIVYDIV